MLETQSVAEQAASHLRKQLRQQRWTGRMPGRDKLARELGVHGSTVERALRQLEHEGLLKTAGPGKPRMIVATGCLPAKASTACVLLYGSGDQTDDYILSLQQHLNEAKHKLSFAPRSMTELKFDPDRIEAMVHQQPADAWIVYSGSKEILQRFTQLRRPTFALFGRMSELPIAGAGTDILSALRDTVGRLHRLGHHKIVMLTRTQLVTSGPGLTERTFIGALEECGIPHGAYNLAEWDNTPTGLRQCLDKLFRVTPPTALFVDDWALHCAVQNYLLKVMGADHRKLNCISMDWHPSFAWCVPAVPHFHWSSDAVVKRAVSWLKGVSRGKPNTRQHMIKAEFRGELQ